MASLQEQLNTPKRKVRGPDGQLVEAEEQTKSLAQSRGLQATPTSPMATQGLGASPDAAKMAGTKEQKQASLGQSMQPADPSRLLSTVRRTETARGQATAGEQAAMQASETIDSLTGIRDQTKGLIKGAIAGMQQNYERDFQRQEAIDAGFSEAQADSMAEFKQIINEGGNVRDAVANYNSQFPGQPLDSDQLLGFFETEEEAVQSMMADSDLASQIKVGPDTLQAIGVTSDDLTELGLTITDDMTLADFLESVNTLIEEEFSRAEELERIANDPNVSSAQRAEARSMLRDLGATGVQDMEQDVQEMDELIATADEITIGDQSFTLEELASDETMSGLIKDLVDDPESEFAKSILEDEALGEFGQFILDNAQQFKTFTDNLEYTTGNFAQAKEHNESLRTIGDVTIPDSILRDSFGDDFGSATDRRYTPTGWMVGLDRVKDGEFTQDFIDAVDMASGEEREQLLRLGPNDIKQIHENGGMDVYLKRLSNRNMRKAGDIDSIIESAGLPDTLPKIKRQMSTASMFGGVPTESGQRVVNFVNDLRDPRSRRRTIDSLSNPLSKEPMPDLSDAKLEYEYPPPEGFTGEPEEYMEIVNTLTPAYLDDNVLSAGEIATALDFDSKDHEYIRNIAKIPGLTREVVEFLERAADNKDPEVIQRRQMEQARLDILAAQEEERKRYQEDPFYMSGSNSL